MHPCLSATTRAGLAALFFCAGCSAPPPAKHKTSTGKFNPWGSYEGKNFSPLNATVTAVDVPSGTITILEKEKKTLHVTPQTRVMHNGTDITLAQLPVNSRIKYTLSADGQQLLTVWYGHTLSTSLHRPSASKQKNTLY